MADAFEWKPVIVGDMKAGTWSLMLSEQGLALEGKRGKKSYPLDRITGYRQLRPKNKFIIEIASDEDLEIVLGGFKGKAAAKDLVETLRALL
jgi:hypothetical protein